MKPAADIVNRDVRALAARAEAYVEGFGWCAGVRGSALGFALGGTLGVFRVELVPAGPGVDAAVWVVVGDLPPAYLACDDGDGWQDALRGYVAEMRRWVAAVHDGESTAALVPVDAPPTVLYADLLARRLDFLQQRLVDADPASLRGDG